MQEPDAAHDAFRAALSVYDHGLYRTVLNTTLAQRVKLDQGPITGPLNLGCDLVHAIASQRDIVAAAAAFDAALAELTVVGQGALALKALIGTASLLAALAFDDHEDGGERQSQALAAIAAAGAAPALHIGGAAPIPAGLQRAALAHAVLVGENIMAGDNARYERAMLEDPAVGGHMLLAAAALWRHYGLAVRSFSDITAADVTAMIAELRSEI